MQRDGQPAPPATPPGTAAERGAAAAPRGRDDGGGAAPPGPRIGPQTAAQWRESSSRGIGRARAAHATPELATAAVLYADAPGRVAFNFRRRAARMEAYAHRGMILGRSATACRREAAPQRAVSLAGHPLVDRETGKLVGLRDMHWWVCEQGRALQPVPQPPAREYCLAATRLSYLRVLVVVGADAHALRALAGALVEFAEQLPNLEMAILAADSSVRLAEDLWNRCGPPAGRRLGGVLMWRTASNLALALMNDRHDFVLGFVPCVLQELGRVKVAIEREAADNGGQVGKATEQFLLHSMVGEAFRAALPKAKERFQSMLRLTAGCFEQVNFFVEPGNPSFDLPLGSMCMGEPDVLWAGQDQLDRGAAGGAQDAGSGPGASIALWRPMSRYLEYYRAGLKGALHDLRRHLGTTKKVVAAGREAEAESGKAMASPMLHDFGDKVFEFRFKGEEEYWRVSTVYLAAALIGWLWSAQNFTRGNSLRPLLAEFCPERVYDSLDQYWRRHGVPGWQDVGEAMTRDWQMPAGIMPFIKFKRRRASLGASHADFRAATAELDAWYGQLCRASKQDADPEALVVVRDLLGDLAKTL